MCLFGVGCGGIVRGKKVLSHSKRCNIQRDVMFHSKGGCGVSFKGVVVIQRSGGYSKELGSIQKS